MNARVLALLPLFFVLAHSFSWDIVMGAGKRLKFYNNGVLTHTENNPSSKEICSVTYDTVHSRVLFAEYDNTNMSISSFDLSTRKIKNVVTRRACTTFPSLAYDPLTQLLFWTEDTAIYSISLKPAVDNAVDITLILTTDNDCRAIAVDSCRGYIHWVTDQKLEKAAFDGSKREVLLESRVLLRTSLAIDQQTQRMYWIEFPQIGDNFPMYISYAELNGQNNSTLYFKNDELVAVSLVISNDFIYWMSYNQKAIMQLPKNEQHDVVPSVYSILDTNSWHFLYIAANYTILEQTRGAKTCEALKSLIPKSPVSNTSDVGLLNVNVTEVSEEFGSSTCQHYCVRGNCSVSAEGLPKCSCEDGYSGERCEVNVCHMYCLHGGVCSLNEKKKPVCQCTADYEGERCHVAITHTGVHTEYVTEQVQRDLRREVKKVIKEELKRALQFLSDKIDEYVTNQI